MSYSLAAADSPGATRVAIVSDINLAGPLAQFSKGAVVQEIANRITTAFVGNFESKLVAPAAASDAASAAPPASGVPQRQSLDAGALLWSVLRSRIGSFFRRLLGRAAD